MKMIEQIKSSLTNAFMMFILEFADPSAVDRQSIEAEMKCSIEEVFSTQKACDRAKRLLKGNFNKMLALYFNQFNSRYGLNWSQLEAELAKNKKHLLRHLGKDKVQYVQLIAALMKQADGGKVKKGLLAS